MTFIEGLWRRLPVVVRAGPRVRRDQSGPWHRAHGGGRDAGEYLQRPIECRHGPVVAILVTGVLFGFAHSTHREVGLVLLPYYLAVAAVYGVLAYLTDSTLPSMVLHAGGNMFSAFDLFTRGRSEWQLSRAPRSLIWQTGPDAAFLVNLAALLLVGTLAVCAYAWLAGVTRAARVSGAA